MNRLRTAAKFAWIHLLFRAGFLKRSRRRLLRSDAILVLTFHRVLADPEFDNTSSLPGMTVRARTFERLLGYLDRNYSIVELGVEAPRFRMNRDKLRVLLTFDDGWGDTYANAFPIARKFSAPFAVFVCPGLVGRTEPFWPERAVRAWRNVRAGVSRRDAEELIDRLKLLPSSERAAYPGIARTELPPDPAEPNNRTMNWFEINEIYSAGVVIGSHTQNHQLLDQCTSQERFSELEDSRIALEEKIAPPILLFAYPNGNWNPDITADVRRSGYKYAFTTDFGAWGPTTKLSAIPRVNISEAKLVDVEGAFSAAMFEYLIVHRASGNMRGEAHSTAKDERSRALLPKRGLNLQ